MRTNTYLHLELCLDGSRQEVFQLAIRSEREGYAVFKAAAKALRAVRAAERAKGKRKGKANA